MNTDSLLAALADPATFAPVAGAADGEVQIVQTHISIVCLVANRVYKLKKPVTLPFVDYAPLARRRLFCQEEVRLNRRLCPDVYLGVAALRATAEGLRFDATLPLGACPTGDGPADRASDDESSDGRRPEDDHPGGGTNTTGEIVDWAVVMRRLPQARMLDELLQRGAVAHADVERLARIVARFHAAGDRSPATLQAGDPARLAAFAAANFEELGAVAGHGLSPQLSAALAARSRRDFESLLPILQRRLGEGRVIDGHGDLHARNICMTEPPTIYDCIEFEPAFRCGDAANEVAFLVMDLRYRGAGELARTFVQTYGGAADDPELAALLPALVGYRAMVRAKVAALAAAEPEIAAADRAGARDSAARHLRLAAAATIEQDGPLWLVTTAPPASGKSSMCRALAAIAGWPHITTDLVRKELAGRAADEHLEAIHYSAEFGDRTYETTLRRAAWATGDGARVTLVDGNFPDIARRQQAAAAARGAGARVVFLHLDLHPDIAFDRLRSRAPAEAHGSDADPSTFAMLQARFVPPRADEPIVSVHLDAADTEDSVVDAALTGLLQAPAAH